MRPLLQRLPTGPRRALPFRLDGRPCTGWEGDNVLTAVLAEQAHVRLADVGGRPRAGLCAMGVCQDCWLFTADGQPLLACATPLAPEMNLVTTTPA